MTKHIVQIRLEVESADVKREILAGFYKDILTDYEGPHYKTNHIEVVIDGALLGFKWADKEPTK